MNCSPFLALVGTIGRALVSRCPLGGRDRFNRVVLDARRRECTSTHRCPKVGNVHHQRHRLKRRRVQAQLQAERLRLFGDRVHEHAANADGARRLHDALGRVLEQGVTEALSPSRRRIGLLARAAVVKLLLATVQDWEGSRQVRALIDRLVRRICDARRRIGASGPASPSTSIGNVNR